MDQADRFDHDQGGPEDRALAPPVPIVIVQRGRSTWARELLLLVLLLSTAGYLFYREYQGPAYLVRDEGRRADRLVDAIPVAPVADGAVVLRAAGTEPVLDDRPVEPIEGPSADRPGSVAAATGPPAPPDGIASAPIPGPMPAATGDELASEGSEGPDGDPTPIEGNDLPAVEPIRQATLPDPPRMSSEILFDRDPRLPPPAEAVAEGPAEGREPEGRRVVDRPEPRPEPRESPAPTFAQRRHFLQLLSFATRQHGLRAGPVIDGLCRDFGTALPPGLGLQEPQLGAMIAGSELERTITGLRRMGAPEPYLLDQISAQMNRAIGVRHGPRDRMEARVFAARKLLSVPLGDARDDRR